MLPFDIQQKCQQSIRSAELLPVIREEIQNAINDICMANPPGKDWSFLKTNFTISRDAGSTDVLLIFDVPKNLRALIEIVSLGGVPANDLINEPYGYLVNWQGRTITISRSNDSQAFPSGDLVVKAYQAHPSLLEVDQQHPNPTWDTEWTSSYPSANAILLPDEAETLIYDTAMFRLRDYETETHYSIEEARQKFTQGVANLAVNYALQVYPLNPSATPSVNWLVAVGQNVVGSERYNNQLLAYVNELAGDFADVVQVQLGDRPTAILVASENALPSIKSVNIPAQYWSAGMIFKAATLMGSVNEVIVANWEKAKAEWKTNYYAIDVQSSNFSLATFGGLVKYIQTEWKSCRSDHQAWTIANEVVSDVMSRVNTDELIQEATFNLIDGQKAYTLPTAFKCVIKVEIDGHEIAGRPFASRGITPPNMNKYQQMFPTPQAFRIVGSKIELDLAPKAGTMKMWYYKNHVWTTTPSASVGVDSLLLIKAVQARVAVEEGNLSRASYFKAEYEAAIQQYNANQYRNYPADDRVINATPSINRDILRSFE